ncbi:MAG: prepilin-type N-terminal cleavage/methylation domain-containing protein [Parcubacteria group bacterium LiPW_72]|nr:MAG: prepilin-type N-terminal cleavage/methylation domain-containing protein [Parcubacteria group bacterium LiPW_72]
MEPEIKTKKLWSKKAFTLIELLVVIAIIGLLATIVTVSVNSARKKARDAKRVADLKQIQTALEIFYDQYGQYPVTAGHTYWDGHWMAFQNCLQTGTGCYNYGAGSISPYTPIIIKVPQDPLDSDPNSANNGTTYYYAWPAGCGNGQSYRLAAYLETPNHPALANDLGGSFYNNNGGCDGQGYCVGAGTCAGW